MITVGLIAELSFISKHLQSPIRCTLKPISSEKYLDIRVELDKNFTLWYDDKLIWSEDINDFFGGESCDTISRIVACIDNKDNSWKNKYPSPK